MPYIQGPSDYLPYIDTQPSDSALSAANALILQEAERSTALHPSLPTQYQAHFSDLIETEHDRIAAGEQKDASTGIELSRYEALDAPLKGDLEAWRSSLQKAYASAEYLRTREVNLGLLETYGKNAWLISNSQLEDTLKGLEREVDEVKLNLENVGRERRAQQEGVAGETKGLEEGWRKGVGRLIEVQAAAEGLRQKILERKRMGAGV